MAKALRRLKGVELKAAIDRRLAEMKGGLGYWAAVDADKALNGKKEKGDKKGAK